jgi:hypothetical protein
MTMSLLHPWVATDVQGLSLRGKYGPGANRPGGGTKLTQSPSLKGYLNLLNVRHLKRFPVTKLVVGPSIDVGNVQVVQQWPSGWQSRRRRKIDRGAQFAGRAGQSRQRILYFIESRELVSSYPRRLARSPNVGFHGGTKTLLANLHEGAGDFRGDGSQINRFPAPLDLFRQNLLDKL